MIAVIAFIVLLTLPLQSVAADKHYCRGISVSAQPGNIAHAQLWNPQGSGKVFILKMIRISAEGTIEGASILANREPLPHLFSNGINVDVRFDNDSKGQYRYAESPVPYEGGMLESNGTPFTSWENYIVYPDGGSPGPLNVPGILVRASDTGGLMKVTYCWIERDL